MIYGAEEHQALKDLIAPSAGRRIGRRLRGTDNDRYDNWAIRRGVLIGSLRAAAGTVDGRYGGMQEAVASAWIAAHFDRIVDDLRGSGHLPSDAEELRLGWAEADADEKQLLLADIHPNAPTAYAFAEAVGERAKPTMSAERALHWLNNVPAYETADLAAGMLMDGSDRMWRFGEQRQMKYAELKAEVAEFIRTEWGNATPGGDIVPLASDLIGRQALDQPQAHKPEIVLDPREGMPDPSGAVNLTKATDTAPATAAVTGKQGQSQGIGH